MRKLQVRSCKIFQFAFELRMCMQWQYFLGYMASRRYHSKIYMDFVFYRQKTHRSYIIPRCYPFFLSFFQVYEQAHKLSSPIAAAGGSMVGGQKPGIATSETWCPGCKMEHVGTMGTVISER